MAKAILIKNSTYEFFPQIVSEILEEYQKKQARVCMYDLLKKDSQEHVIRMKDFSLGELKKHANHFVKIPGKTDWFYTYSQELDSIITYKAVEVPDNYSEWEIKRGSEINEIVVRVVS